MCMEEINFIGGCVDISSMSISLVNFLGFRFGKVYKRFGVKNGGVVCVLIFPRELYLSFTCFSTYLLLSLQQKKINFLCFENMLTE